MLSLALSSSSQAQMGDATESGPWSKRVGYDVTISVPNDFTAAAQRLLTGRRGQILGYAEKSEWQGWDDVEALVPAAELHELIAELRQKGLLQD